MAKRIKPTTADEIRQLMVDANIYEARFEHQIKSAARLQDEIGEMYRIVKKDGRVIEEMKDKGIGFKKVAHPLLPQISSFEKELRNQYTALGLNKLSEKKAEGSNPGGEDKMADFFNSLNK